MSASSSSGSSVDQAALSFWRTIGQSLRGKNHDYTVMSLNRAVVLLAVPMVFEMIMQSLIAMVNIVWASRLGTEAVAAVGLTESMMTVVYSIAVGLSIAATALVARRIGEKNPERAARVAGQILVLGAFISVGSGLVFAFTASDILRMMGAGESVVAAGGDFAHIMLSCNFTVFLTFLINAIFRGAGDAVLAMRTLWLANVLNIVLGPCFIFGWGLFPELGITGAAVATNLGRGAAVLYQLWHLTNGRGRIRLQLRHLLPAVDDTKIIMMTASNGVAQLLISTTSYIVLFKTLAQFGSAAVAGYTIAIRVVMSALMPAYGLANAGATLVGQNIGAGRPDRAEEAIKIATWLNVILLGFVAVVLVIVARPMVSLFTSDSEVLDSGSRALWIVSLALPLYAAGACMAAAFNGVGDAWTPTRLNFFCFWIGQVPLAWALARIFELGPTGVFISVPVSFLVLVAWSASLFKQGRWKHHKV